MAEKMAEKKGGQDIRVVDDDQIRFTVQTPHAGGDVERLPPGFIKQDSAGLLSIDVKKFVESKLLRDQRNKMVSSMGCVSNPGGPGC